MYRRKDWQDVPAVKNRNVFCIPEAFLLDVLGHLWSMVSWRFVKLSRRFTTLRMGKTNGALPKKSSTFVRRWMIPKSVFFAYFQRNILRLGQADRSARSSSLLTSKHIIRLRN